MSNMHLTGHMQSRVVEDNYGNQRATLGVVPPH